MLKVFPEGQQMKPAPAYDEGSSPLPKKRKASEQRPLFELAGGDGQVIISVSILLVIACLPPDL